MSKDFAKTLVNDYDEQGLALKVDDLTLTDLDESGVEVEFEPRENGLIVLVDGFEEFDHDYEYENFNVDLIKVLAGALNF